MKILLINFFGSLLVIMAQTSGPLSRRLEALKSWPSQQNRLLHQ